MLKKAVGVLISGLLEISGNKADSESAVVLLKSKCLGQLGAISPAFLDFSEISSCSSKITSNSKKVTNKTIKTGEKWCANDSTDTIMLPCIDENDSNIFAREVLANVLFPLMQKSSDEKLVFAAKRVLTAARVDFDVVRRHERRKARSRLSSGKGVVEGFKKDGFWVWDTLPKDVRKVFWPLFGENEGKYGEYDVSGLGGEVCSSGEKNFISFYFFSEEQHGFKK